MSENGNGLPGGLPLTLPAEVLEALADLLADKVAERVPGSAPPLPDDGHLAYKQAEAAELLGMSEDHFQRHVLPEVRSIRSGRLRLIPRSEIEAWSERNAGRLGDR